MSVAWNPENLLSKLWGQDDTGDGLPWRAYAGQSSDPYMKMLEQSHYPPRPPSQTHHC